jgi:signal peptidase I
LPVFTENIPPEDSNGQTWIEQPAEVSQKAPEPGWWRVVLDVFETLVLALILYVVIDAVVARVRVVNISMLPTLVPGEFVMVNKLAYKFGDFKHGDIVVFHHNESEDYVKRVIGLPGDEIEIKNGIVYISGRPFIEPYIKELPRYEGTWTVPEGTLFVLGDNRNESSDSHDWGFVPIPKVVGRAMLIYWPPQQMRIFRAVE